MKKIMISKKKKNLKDRKKVSSGRFRDKCAIKLGTIDGR